MQRAIRAEDGDDGDVAGRDSLDSDASTASGEWRGGLLAQDRAALLSPSARSLDVRAPRPALWPAAPARPPPTAGVWPPWVHGAYPANGGLCGLSNLGNTCYFNAAVAALAHVPPLAAALTEAGGLHRQVALAAAKHQTAVEAQLAALEKGRRALRSRPGGADAAGAAASSSLEAHAQALHESIPLEPAPPTLASAFSRHVVEAWLTAYGGGGEAAAAAGDSAAAEGGGGSRRPEGPFALLQPRQLLHRLRAANPVFDNWQQHDSCEAVRTLLNELHAGTAVELPLGLAVASGGSRAAQPPPPPQHAHTSAAAAASAATSSDRSRSSGSSLRSGAKRPLQLVGDDGGSGDAVSPSDITIESLSSSSSSSTSSSSVHQPRQPEGGPAHRSAHARSSSRGASPPRSGAAATGDADAAAAQDDAQARAFATAEEAAAALRPWLRDGPYTGPDVVQRSPVADHCQGLLSSRVLCRTCAAVSITYDAFFDLALPIPRKQHPVARGGSGTQWPAAGAPPPAAAVASSGGGGVPVAARRRAAAADPASAAVPAAGGGSRASVLEPPSISDWVGPQAASLAAHADSSHSGGRERRFAGPLAGVNAQYDVNSGAAGAAATVRASGGSQQPQPPPKPASGGGMWASISRFFGGGPSSSATTGGGSGSAVGYDDGSSWFGGLTGGSGGPPVGLADCLLSFCDWEPLVGSDAYACTSTACVGSKRDADKRLGLAALPDVLCLQLKRFHYSANAWSSGLHPTKNSTPVSYPLTGLDISPLLAVSNDCDAHAAAVKLYTRGKEQVTGRRLRGNSLLMQHASAGHHHDAAAATALDACTSPLLSGSAGAAMRIDSVSLAAPASSSSAAASSSSSSSSAQPRPHRHHSVREYMSPDLRSWMLHRALLSTGSTGVEAVDAKLSGGLSQLPPLLHQSSPSAPTSPERDCAPAAQLEPLHAGISAHLPPARLAEPPPTYRSPASAAHHGPAAMGPPLYDLCALIEHIGASLTSGHYIAHVRHRTSGAWFTLDDSSVREIAPSDVAKKEAYVLFYSRQLPPVDSGVPSGGAALASALSAATPVKSTEAAATAAQRAPGPCPLPTALLSEPVYCFVSRQWWSRYCSVAVPGPISCGDVLCDHGAVKRQLADHIRNFTVALTSKQYAALLAAYGAAEAPLTSLEACRECKVEGSLLSERRKREKERILQVDSVNIGPLDECMLMSEWWLAQWRQFIENGGATDGTGRGTLPPGPVDNARLLGKGAKPLPNQRPVVHYRGVDGRVWSFLHSIYGGGPALPRQGINLYGEAV